MFHALSVRPTRLLLRQLLDFGSDRCTSVRRWSKWIKSTPKLTFRIQTLEGNLLLQTTTTLLVCPDVRILGGQPTFEQPSTVFGAQLEVTEYQPGQVSGEGATYTSLPVQGLDHQHEWRRSNLLGCFLIDDVQGRLVNQANIHSLLTETQDSVVRSVQHVSKGHDISGGTFQDSLVLSWNKLVTVTEEFGSVSLQDVWNFGTV